MSRRWTVSAILFILILIGHQWIASSVLKTVNLGLIGLSALVMAFLSKKMNFLYTLVVSLFYGFILMGVAYFHEMVDVRQLQFIWANGLVLGALLLLWQIYSFQEELVQQNRDMKKKLQRLKKYDEQSGALTYREFIEQAKMIETITKRKKETAYLIYLTNALEAKEVTQKALLKKVVEACLQATRNRYDLVCALGDKGVLVLLQNPGEEGLSLVLSRIKTLLKEHIHKIDQAIEYKIVKMDDLHQALSTLRLPLPDEVMT